RSLGLLDDEQHQPAKQGECYDRAHNNEYGGAALLSLDLLLSLLTCCKPRVVSGGIFLGHESTSWFRVWLILLLRLVAWARANCQRKICCAARSPNRCRAR